ncbi:MAG: hypothetical protein DRQ62_06170 [Gammaproteobacteria bacterium]|nr:MAG: hypothetical protein DRQ62_06170 [Gammaproteobacteria bacterium]
MIETEIKKLTEAVNSLTTAILKADQVTEAVLATIDEPAVTITEQDVKDLAKAQIAANVFTRPEVKQFIKDAGADAISSLSEEGLVEVHLVLTNESPR